MSRAKTKKISKEKRKEKAFYLAKRLGVPRSLVLRCNMDEKTIRQIKYQILDILNSSINVNTNMLLVYPEKRYELIRLKLPTKYTSATVEYLLKCLEAGKLVYKDEVED